MVFIEIHQMGKHNLYGIDARISLGQGSESREIAEGECCKVRSEFDQNVSFGFSLNSFSL